MPGVCFGGACATIEPGIYTPAQSLALKHHLDGLPLRASFPSKTLRLAATEADLDGPLATEINRYLETDTASAKERVRLFRLAWDTCCSAFASRQVLYERFFQGDSQRNALILDQLCDKGPMTEMVKEFLERSAPAP